MSYASADDAASALDFMLGLRFPASSKYEYMSGLYAGREGVGYTAPQTSHQATHVDTKLAAPADATAWLGLFHNHPQTKGEDPHAMKALEGGEEFSADDRKTAETLHLPSYISTPSGALRKFDPSTGQTEDVLGAFPIEEFKTFLMQRLLNRAPDDPRGLRL